MKKSKIALFIGAAMGASGTSLADVTINQSGAAHTTDIVQFGAAPSSNAVVTQSGDAAHNVRIRQSAFADFNIEVLQDGDNISNEAEVIQVVRNPDASTVFLEQDGDGLDATIRSNGDAASNNLPNDYSATQTGIGNILDINSDNSAGETVVINQADFENTANVRSIGSESVSVTIGQEGFSNLAEATLTNGSVGTTAALLSQALTTQVR